MKIHVPTESYQYQYRPTHPNISHKPRLDSFPHKPDCNIKGLRKYRGKSHTIKTLMTDWTTVYVCNRCDATARIVWVGDADRAGYELPEPDLAMGVNPFIAHHYS